MLQNGLFALVEYLFNFLICIFSERIACATQVIFFTLENQQMNLSKVVINCIDILQKQKRIMTAVLCLWMQHVKLLFYQ